MSTNIYFCDYSSGCACPSCVLDIKAGGREDVDRYCHRLRGRRDPCDTCGKLQYQPSHRVDGRDPARTGPVCLLDGQFPEYSYLDSYKSL